MLPALAAVLALQAASPGGSHAQAGGAQVEVAGAHPEVAGAHAQAGGARAQAVPPAIHYTIEASLDEETQVLRAAQIFRYRNGSRDTLRSLYFHLHLNAFRPGSIWARTERRPRYRFGELEDPEYGYERLRSVRLLAGPSPEGAAGPEAVVREWRDRDARQGARPRARPGEAVYAEPSRAVVERAIREGQPLTPVYPHAPDSTVVRLDLPRPLPPDQGVTLHMVWDARPSTLCRRQCREGRSWDLAQWYPRVAVHDRHGWQAHPLYPQGEFYGDFATYDVTLELAADQVVGATGVPVTGDPGWRPGPGSPLSEPLYQRDFYGSPPPRVPPGLLEEEVPSDRRRVRFFAESVHHFAWSTSPDYRYEGDVFARGDLPDVALHVLYRPGDEDWDEGVALDRTFQALSWLETVFRPYPHPQLTNLHRIEGGGTEFPMVVMNGSASMGLIAHEVTHQYAHGILASNEWRDAWLDEGLTSFLDTWFAEEHGDPEVWRGFMERTASVERALNDPRVRRDPPRGLRGLASGDTLPAPMPIDTLSEAFANYGQYGWLSYTRPQAVFYMLREELGKEVMRQTLKTYYDRWGFRHPDGEAFRAVAEEVSGRDLDDFFADWIRGTGTLDWSVRSAEVERRGDGWRVTVGLGREGEAFMPITVRVEQEAGPPVERRVETRDRTPSVVVETAGRPRSVELDPRRVLLEVDRSDNRRDLSAAEGS